MLCASSEHSSQSAGIASLHTRLRHCTRIRICSPSSFFDSSPDSGRLSVSAMQAQPKPAATCPVIGVCPCCKAFVQMLFTVDVKMAPHVFPPLSMPSAALIPSPFRVPETPQPQPKAVQALAIAAMSSPPQTQQSASPTEILGLPPPPQVPTTTAPTKLPTPPPVPEPAAKKPRGPTQLATAPPMEMRLTAKRGGVPTTPKARPMNDDAPAVDEQAPVAVLGSDSDGEEKKEDDKGQGKGDIDPDQEPRPYRGSDYYWWRYRKGSGSAYPTDKQRWKEDWD